MPPIAAMSLTFASMTFLPMSSGLENLREKWSSSTNMSAVRSIYLFFEIFTIAASSPMPSTTSLFKGGLAIALTKSISFLIFAGLIVNLHGAVFSAHCADIRIGV